MSEDSTRRGDASVLAPEEPAQEQASTELRLRFGPFELVPARVRLERAGTEIPIAPKPYAALLHLVRQRQRVVPKQELLEAVWPGVTVSDAAFTSVIRDLRRLLQDTAQRSEFVSTVRGRGLRFICPVVESQEAIGASAHRSTWEVAAERLERALPALDAVRDLRGGSAEPQGASGRDRSEILLALGRARWAAGATTDSRSIFLRAAEAARAAGDGEIFGWSALGFAGRTDLAPDVSEEAVALLEEALVRSQGHSASLRAELHARLGTELYFAQASERSEALTQRAVALAEAADDKGVLAYALTARQFVLYRPDVRPEDRLPISERAIDLLSDTTASDVLALALQERMVDLLELGDGASFRECYPRFREVVDVLEQPFFLWIRTLFDGLQALLAGDLVNAERLSFDALALGRRAGTPNAFPTHLAQLFALREEQGRLSELADLLQTLSDEQADSHLVLAALASARAAGGERKPAEAALRRLLAANLNDVSHDLHWLPTLAMVAQVAAAVGAPEQIETVRRALEPYQGRIIVFAYAAATLGGVDHHLGVLAAAVERGAEADEYFRKATRLHERAGAQRWAERSRQAQA